MKYVSFNYYTEEYLGRTISSENEFFSICIRAEAYIDRLTDGHITEVTDDIKNAVCAVCDVIHRADRERGIKSESVDGYSITLDHSQTSERTLYETARLFLPSYLLYRGV